MTVGPEREIVPGSALGRPFALALLFCALASHGEASQVRPINLEEMSRRAARIFSGQCLEVRSERDPSLGLEVTILKFKVHHVAKGGAGRTVTLRILGGGADPGPMAGVTGVPAFRAGEEVILFLYGESRIGLTSPVGMAQGKFSIATDKGGRRLAVNGVGNRRLFKGLSAEGARRIAGTPRGAAGDRDLTPEALLHMAEALGR